MSLTTIFKVLAFVLFIAFVQSVLLWETLITPQSIKSATFTPNPYDINERKTKNKCCALNDETGRAEMLFSVQSAFLQPEVKFFLYLGRKKKRRNSHESYRFAGFSHYPATFSKRNGAVCKRAAKQQGRPKESRRFLRRNLKAQ